MSTGGPPFNKKNMVLGKEKGTLEVLLRSSKQGQAEAEHWDPGACAFMSHRRWGALSFHGVRPDCPSDPQEWNYGKLPGDLTYGSIGGEGAGRQERVPIIHKLGKSYQKLTCDAAIRYVSRTMWNKGNRHKIVCSL